MIFNCGVEEDFESPLDCKDIQPVHPRGNQSWIIGRTDVEAETPILWPSDAKNWLIRKDPDAGKDWRQEEKGKTEDEMIGWHHWLNEHESEPILADSEGQGSWHAAVHGVAKSQTCLSDWTTTTKIGLFKMLLCLLSSLTLTIAHRKDQTCTVIITWEMRNLTHREAKGVLQSHVTRWWWSCCGLQVRCQDSRSVLLAVF